MAKMISAINTVSIRKKIPSFLTVPFWRIIRLIHCGMPIDIFFNKVSTGYLVLAEIFSSAKRDYSINFAVQTPSDLVLNVISYHFEILQGGEGIRTLINPLSSMFFSAGERMAALPPHLRFSPEFSKIKALLMWNKISPPRPTSIEAKILLSQPVWGS
jgi:hypothetical protein